MTTTRQIKFVKNAEAQYRVVGAARQALVSAARALRDDLAASGTVPLESGHLQNTATTVDVSGAKRGVAAVVSDTVYARRKYFNPQFNFDRSVNRFAGGRWFDTYLSGGKRLFAVRAFGDSIRGSLCGID